MGRNLPTECDDCGEIMDWGDFGPDDDPLVGIGCRCAPVERPSDLDIANYIARLECALADARALAPVNEAEMERVRPWCERVLAKANA